MNEAWPADSGFFAVVGFGINCFGPWGSTARVLEAFCWPWNVWCLQR